MKANAVIFYKQKGKQDSYFVTYRNNNLQIISNKSPTKTNTVNSPKIISPSTAVEKSNKSTKATKASNPVEPKTY